MFTLIVPLQDMCGAHEAVFATITNWQCCCFEMPHFGDLYFQVVIYELV